MLDWSLLLAAVAILWQFSFRTFVLFALAGLVVGLLCWWAGLHFSALWNTRFHMRLRHHVLCLLAAFTTTTSVVALAGFQLARQAAHESLVAWESEVVSAAAQTAVLPAEAWSYLDSKVPGLQRMAEGGGSLRQSAAAVRSEVEDRVENFVFQGQLLALLALLLSQMAAFGTIAWEAYRDIKVNT